MSLRQLMSLHVPVVVSGMVVKVVFGEVVGLTVGLVVEVIGGLP